MGDLVFPDRAAHRAWLAAQSALPAGFRAAAREFGFTARETGKPAKMTLNLVALDEPTPAFAAVFTKNAFPGAPVKIGRARLDHATLGAIIVNNKISNVCAPDGEAHAERICAAVADALGLAATAVLPSSTGVIGWQLPVDAMCAEIPALAAALSADSILPVAEGIMTTDLYPKVRRVEASGGSIVGFAKGAGMIEPDLATMLVYLLTDLDVPRDALRTMLPAVMGPTFNAISIDSDQSTSDTVVLVSSRKVPCDDVRAAAGALADVCVALSQDVVRNGEGVHHVIRCQVSGAPSIETARGVGKSIVNSPLVQCAICGNDANVGRLIMAIGKYCGGVGIELDPSKVRISVAGVEVFSGGSFLLNPDIDVELATRLKSAALYESAPPDARGVFRPPIDYPPHERVVDLQIDLGVGSSAFDVLGADRSHEYISENADYRS